MSNTLDTPFDTENEEGTPPITLLPAGKYGAEIVSATVGPTKNGKGQAIKLQWVITDPGQYEKRVLFQSVLIQHESEDAQRFGRQRLKDICVACGVKEKLTDLDVLLFKACKISVAIRKDKDGAYPDQNEIKRVAPAVEVNRPLPPIDKDLSDSIPF
jgi:hypothetical protein